MGIAICDLAPASGIGKAIFVHVVDLNATLSRAQAKGARVIAGPMDVPGGGRIVQLTDPQGAIFALHEQVTA
jgi:predicted enzyme related to lactoylglutathione lyase